MKRSYLLILVLVFFCSCLRYVPSRREIEEEEGKTGDVAQFAGEEAFYSLDQRQKDRLQTLLQERHADQTKQTSGSYRIGPGDVLRFEVFEVQELNREVRVRPDGSITLPLIGVIQTQGKSEQEVQDEVSKRLEEFVYTPQVQVFISQYGAQKISVIGEVQKPGAYPLLRDNYTLAELMGEAGGRTEKASSIIVLIPALPDQQNATPLAQDQVARARLADPNQRFGIEIYFDDLVGSISKPPVIIPLRAGDTVIVPEAGMVQIDGEVNKPGSFQLASRMSLIGAVATAGGLTYSADVNQVEVIRELGEGKKALITVNLEQIALQQGNDIRLRDGDVVRVPSHGSRFATRQVINTLNSFLHFGVSGNVNAY